MLKDVSHLLSQGQCSEVILQFGEVGEGPNDLVENGVISNIFFFLSGKFNFSCNCWRTQKCKESGKEFH